MKLGFTVSQATVSRYMPASDRRPRQSWRTFICNQTIAFSRRQSPEEQSDRVYAGLRLWFDWGRLMRSVAQIARLSAGLCRWHAHQTLTPTARRIALRSGQRARGAMHCVHPLAAVPGRGWKTHGNRRQTAVPMRSPPYEARASPRPRATQDVTLDYRRVGFRHAVYDPLRLTRRTHRRHGEPSGRPS
jgi:hypothetical protein